MYKESCSSGAVHAPGGAAQGYEPNAGATRYPVRSARGQMSSTGRLFIAGMWGVGLLVGVLIALMPELLALPMPHLTVPLIAGLLVELAIRPAISAGRVAALGGTERGVGVIGAAVIALVSSTLLRSGSPS